MKFTLDDEGSILESDTDHADMQFGKQTIKKQLNKRKGK